MGNNTCIYDTINQVVNEYNKQAKKHNNVTILFNKETFELFVSDKDVTINNDVVDLSKMMQQADVKITLKNTRQFIIDNFIDRLSEVINYKHFDGNYIKYELFMNQWKVGDNLRVNYGSNQIDTTDRRILDINDTNVVLIDMKLFNSGSIEKSVIKLEISKGGTFPRYVKAQ